MKVDLYSGFRIKPISHLFLQCSPWSVCMLPNGPIDALQMLLCNSGSRRCSSFCSSCCSYITLSLHLRKCPELSFPVFLRFSTTPEMWPCWSQAYSRTAEDGEVPLRWWVYMLDTEQFLCSLPVLPWILLEKREYSGAGGPFVFHVTLSLRQMARSCSVQSYF